MPYIDVTIEVTLNKRVYIANRFLYIAYHWWSNRHSWLLFSLRPFPPILLDWDRPVKWWPLPTITIKYHRFD